MSAPHSRHFQPSSGRSTATSNKHMVQNDSRRGMPMLHRLHGCQPRGSETGSTSPGRSSTPWALIIATERQS